MSLISQSTLTGTIPEARVPPELLLSIVDGVVPVPELELLLLLLLDVVGVGYHDANTV
jgi:hypothetical protein